MIDAQKIYLNSFYIALISNLSQIWKNKYREADFYKRVHCFLFKFLESTRLFDKKYDIIPNLFTYARNVILAFYNSYYNRQGVAN